MVLSTTPVGNGSEYSPSISSQGAVHPLVTRPSPCLGQHNEYVYKELLGLTDDEIAEGLITGAITVSGGEEIRDSV